MERAMLSPYELPEPLIDRVVVRALEEDLASGDLTTEACIDLATQAVAHALARAPMVVCGGAGFARGFARGGAPLTVEIPAADGPRPAANQPPWAGRGRA